MPVAVENPEEGENSHKDRYSIRFLKTRNVVSDKIGNGGDVVAIDAERTVEKNTIKQTAERPSCLVGSAHDVGPLDGRLFVSPVQKDWRLDGIRVDFGIPGML
jgi:hypothetical protein